MTWDHAAQWDYVGQEPRPYGDEHVYRVGMDLLADCATVEDWGCGYAWAKRFREGDYIGVDWAPGFADVVADLRTYTSEVDGIFMRSVLEHNPDWMPILDNALASTPHLVLALFTPMADETHVIRTNEYGTVDIAFAPDDIEERFGDRPFTVADYATATEYGTERIYDVG